MPRCSLSVLESPFLLRIAHLIWPRRNVQLQSVVGFMHKLGNRLHGAVRCVRHKSERRSESRTEKHTQDMCSCQRHVEIEIKVHCRRNECSICRLNLSLFTHVNALCAPLADTHSLCDCYCGYASIHVPVGPSRVQLQAPQCSGRHQYSMAVELGAVSFSAAHPRETLWRHPVARCGHVSIGCLPRSCR